MTLGTEVVKGVDSISCFCSGDCVVGDSTVGTFVGIEEVSFSDSLEGLFVKVGGVETEGLNVVSIEDDCVGTEEAATVGIKVFSFVSTYEGCCEGAEETTIEGLDVGSTDGNCVGTEETLNDGLPETEGGRVVIWVGSFVRVGMTDGEKESRCEGTELGSFVVSVEGLLEIDGNCDGTCVGTLEIVGDIDGKTVIVGELEGDKDVDGETEG